jgi:hypothetical protein
MMAPWWPSARMSRRPSPTNPSGNPSAGRSKKPFRPTKVMRDEIAWVLMTIEVAVTACVPLRRWSDLEGAVLLYAQMMSADPCLLLQSALLS